ncbi:MAG: cysteine desulfurase family protein [Candidatus Nanoarchaeia archaeon]
MKHTYLDHGATTPIDKKVYDAMQPFLQEKFGNASSMHGLGFIAKDALETSRERIAKQVGVQSKEVFFTSGGTESNNWALKGIMWANADKGKHLIISNVEHKCILRSADWLEKQGYEVTKLPVNSKGEITAQQVKDALRKDTVLVSIMHANNEIGTINDIESIAKVCKENKTYFHSDACQSFLKVPLNLKKTDIDMLSINSHKINGPKGIGALVIKKHVRIDALIHGGGQEDNKRGGTENIPAIVGFAKASTLISKKDVANMQALRDKLIKKILTHINGVSLNGPTGDKRLCNNINLSFEGIEGEAIGGLLDHDGILTSTGSACSSASLDPSYVLQAIGLSHEQANGSLRLTIGKEFTHDDVEKVVASLKKATKKLRRISPLKRIFLKKKA